MKTMKNRFLALALATIAWMPAESQSMLGDIHGRVLEDDTKEGVYGAVVRAYRAGSEVTATVTDMDGYFSIKSIPSGTYNLKFIAMGKDTLLITNVEVNADKVTWRQNILMKTSGELAQYEIIADKIPLINPSDPSAITVGYQEIKNSPNIRNLSKLLGSMTTDFKTGIDGGDAYVRGSRSSSNVYFIDGIKQRGSVTVPGVAIGKVTVYTGGVPAKYGDTTGGVVILETKSYFDLYNERQGQK